MLPVDDAFIIAIGSLDDADDTQSIAGRYEKDGVGIRILNTWITWTIKQPKEIKSLLIKFTLIDQ